MMGRDEGIVSWVWERSEPGQVFICSALNILHLMRDLSRDEFNPRDSSSPGVLLLD